MNNNSLYFPIFIIFGAGVLVLASFFIFNDGFDQKSLLSALSGGSQNTTSDFKLTEEELVDMVKPAVVRVAQDITVDAEVPVFKIDFNKKQAVFSSTEKPWAVKFETPLVGSGFIVNPNGYILTNAHVVSDETVKSLILVDVVNKVVLANAASLSKADVDYWSKNQDAWHALGEEIYKEVAAKTSFKLDKKITVVNPSSKDVSAADLIKNGFPAQVVKVNDNFLNDNRDTAIIKINEKNLPAIELDSTSVFNTGTKIYVFGFPATAEFSKESFIEPTFTQGVISALKDSQKNDFKILQTDAKVSQGSSGGPMIDDNGHVIGIITYETDSSQTQATGDNFAFAIPAKIGKSMLNDILVSNIAGNYESHFKAGLVLVHDKRCKKAIEQFNFAKNINSNFVVDSYVDPYIKECTDMIAKGQSVDDWWGELKEWFGRISYIEWIIVGLGAVIFVVLIVFVVFLAKKMKGKNKEINKLEDLMLEEAAKENVQREELEKMLKNEEKPGNPTITASQPSEPAITQQPVEQPQTVAVDPQVEIYIKQSREAGFDDNAISAELKKSGWTESDIQNALAK